MTVTYANGTDTLHMDLETKIAQYVGHGKIARLSHIIHNCPDLKLQGLRTLYDFLEHNSKDVVKAKLVATELALFVKSDEIDTDWILTRQRQCAADKLKLTDGLREATAGVLASSMAVSQVMIAWVFSNIM